MHFLGMRQVCLQAGRQPLALFSVAPLQSCWSSPHSDSQKYFLLNKNYSIGNRSLGRISLFCEKQMELLKEVIGSSEIYVIC